VTIGKGPRHSHQRGVGGIVYARSPAGHTDCVVPIGVIVQLGHRNPTHSWTGMVGPSLPGFTITPCVDSLLHYRIDQAV
jgi:hypothetical protein